MTMQTTTRYTAPEDATLSAAARTPRTPIPTDRFGRFEPVTTAGGPARPGEPGRVAIDDAEELLSLFDPYSAPTRADETFRGDQGEHLAPLVPPVISDLTLVPLRRAHDSAPRVARPAGLRPVAAPAVSVDRQRAVPVAAATAQPRTPRRRRGRLTFRGRLAVVLLIAGAVAGVSALAGQDLPAGEVSATEGQFVEIEVQEGDTISSIAQRVSDGYDAASVVAAIQSANDLDVSAGSSLEPGSILLVPSS